MHAEYLVPYTKERLIAIASQNVQDQPNYGAQQGIIIGASAGRKKKRNKAYFTLGLAALPAVFPQDWDCIHLALF